MTQQQSNYLTHEFDRQVQNLIDLGYPQLVAMTSLEFNNQIHPLKSQLKSVMPSLPDIATGFIPFVIVISHHRVTPEDMMSLVNKQGNPGVTILRPHTSKNFQTISSVNIPNSFAYLLINIYRGGEYRNITPHDALKSILDKNYSPLTIAEGIALITHYPEFIFKNNCFSLLASRTGTDKRVPAIWINSKKSPNLGWCWDGNPHTWLGSAYCQQRLPFEILPNDRVK